LIELAARDDAPDVLRIVNAAYDHADAGIWEPGWARTRLEAIERMIEAGEVAVLRAGGRVVGGVRVRRLDDETAEFGMLSVDPAAMGTGAGRALIAFAEQHHGTPFMQLELLVPRAPHPHKRRLHEWYSRLGYVQTSEREFDEPLLAGPADMRTYRKSLRAAPAT
jgi:GNAT superfamily N-acetyltransferase